MGSGISFDAACVFDSSFSFTSFFESLVRGMLDNQTIHRINLMLGTWVNGNISLPNLRPVDDFYSNGGGGVRSVTLKATRQVPNSQPPTLAVVLQYTYINERTLFRQITARKYHFWIKI